MRTKERPEEEIKDLIHRLNRVEGQIRGIRGMIEKDAYCVDILNQVSAATSALNSFTRGAGKPHPQLRGGGHPPGTGRQAGGAAGYPPEADEVRPLLWNNIL